ncbi:MAG: DNA polymerase III subunit delta [Pirellulaceae bacterium]
MAKGIHCFRILMDRALPGDLPPVIAAYGDDAFLRRETPATIMELAGIQADEARVFDGEECKWIDVHDELATLSLFETKYRVAVVKAADKLIKDARAQLEKWCESAAQGSLLLLQINTFPSNTKLFKLIDKHGWCVDCGLPTGGGRSKTPSMPEIKKWLQGWGKSQHGLKLNAAAATLVLDAVGPDCGLLHQELAKLALYADESGKISDDLIRQHVGSWRTRTMWEIADAVADGRIADALEQLERVFAAGEHPAAVIPQIAWSLRRFSHAAHLILQAQRQGTSLNARAAVSQSGFWGNDVQLAEVRLKKMGLRRASKLYDWLLELDLKIKGSHSNPNRAIFALEELCLRFAQV